MKYKKGTGIFLAAVFCLSLLAGCAEKQETESKPEPKVSLRNDGRQAEIVLGQLDGGAQRTGLLTEIAAKYTADFPETAIEVRTFESREALDSALAAGELDIVQLDRDALYGAAEKNLLLELKDYMEAWDESVTLTEAARQAMASLGAGTAYLIPSDITHDLIYYRGDWFDEYNEGKENQEISVWSWARITGDGTTPGPVQALGDRGRLAFAGKEKLLDYFDAMVWSDFGIRQLGDPAAAYFASGDSGETIFSDERARQGADRFLRVMQEVALPEALDWTEEQAVEAFQQGRAAMLLADRSAGKRLWETMPQGSVAVYSFPRGVTTTGVFADTFSGWGVSAATADPEITVHFLTFLSNADNNTRYASVQNTLPIHTQAADIENALAVEDMKVEMNMILRADWYQYASEPGMYSAHRDYREPAEEKLRQFIAGELDRDGLLSFLDGYWKDAYAREGKLWTE